MISRDNDLIGHLLKMCSPGWIVCFEHLADFFLMARQPYMAWASSFRRGFMVTHFETHHSR
jgi:hypothetical protein